MIARQTFPHGRLSLKKKKHTKQTESTLETVCKHIDSQRQLPIFLPYHYILYYPPSPFTYSQNNEQKQTKMMQIAYKQANRNTEINKKEATFQRNLIP